MPVMVSAEVAPVLRASGPPGLPLLGHLVPFGRDPLAFFARLRDEHGDIAAWSLGRRRSLLLSRPEHIAEFLGAVERTFEVIDISWMFRRLIGASVLLSRGEDWRRKRALVQPAVRPRQVRGYAATMVECGAAHADGWHDGRRVDVMGEMNALTQRIIVRTLFGGDVGDRHRALADAVAVAQREIGAELGSVSLFLPGWVRTPARRRLLAAVATIDAEVNRLIGDRMAAGSGPGQGDDLLARLLAARDEKGRPLTPREVRDEAVTLWAAGHETTATTLTWTWYLLSRSPRARERLHGELARVLGGRPPGYDDYERLDWTRQVVKEALRLYPPAWTVSPAVAHEGATLGGAPVPVGTTVWCSPWITHRDPRWFPDPEAFRPERWDPDAPTAVPDHAWFPFGGGQRACLGARFALVEATLLIATLAQRFHLDVDAGEPTPHPGILLQPAEPLRATLRAL
ncbi:cytochrome P450 [Kitasatospora sp. NPDC008115]|uniref:cytochrome P450 n=1 Tax=Kitasatospora sp. NPDC008115 TaxID=3364022 RepID=UPI0036E917A2